VVGEGNILHPNYNLLQEMQSLFDLATAKIESIKEHAKVTVVEMTRVWIEAKFNNQDRLNVAASAHK
jgi:hypothetical protein